jgi:GTP 3',8-cyclase
MILDSFHRKHDYLRISLTDVCNFRCTYCIPNENMLFMPSEKIMQSDEIEKIAEIFVRLGVTKIRLTGGEPLARKDFSDIVSKLARFPITLTLTTNGYLLNRYLTDITNAGITSLNISLDSLQAFRFKKITQRDYFDTVWNNILLAHQAGMYIKINVVLMRGVNDDEILDFIALTKKYPFHVRFIEFMPFDKNEWDNKKVFTYQEVLQVAQSEFDYIPLKGGPHDTSKKFKVVNALGTFAVISTLTAPFCSGCNRMRLTADGKMKNCLFSKGEVDILSALRAEENIIPLIQACVQAKKEALGGQLPSDYKKINNSVLSNRSMIAIGG